jgi:hypothetical protein
METACDIYTGPSGSVYAASGIYFDTLINSQACDSVIEINLVILESTFSSLEIAECSEYISPSGNVYTIPGTYIDTIENFIGCDSIITIEFSLVEMNMNVTIDGNRIWANQYSASYQWLDCDNDFAEISGADNLFYDVTAIGNYAVEITFENCVDTSDCVYWLEIDDLYIPNINIFPNPVSKKLFVEFDTGNDTYDIQIFNTLGIEILSRNNYGDNLMKIDFIFPAGVYFILIRKDMILFQQKIIKE